AWELCRAGVEVTVLEAGPGFGGRIAATMLAGRPVDLGADAFLVRAPQTAAVDLCRELGLESELVAPAAEGAALWTGGRLRPLPSPTVLGVPAGLAGLVGVARSGLLSPAGVARAAADLVLPRRRSPVDDRSVDDLVSDRLGRQVARRLVDPLVGGIHAGDSSRLSARAVAPQLWSAAASGRSLALSLGRQRRASVPAARLVFSHTNSPGPAFRSLNGGLGRLVGVLVDALRAAGAGLETGVTVRDLAEVGSGYRPVVLAIPAAVAAALVAAASPEASAALARIEHASVVLVALAYPVGAFPRPLVGTGFLVPAGEGRLLTACSYGSVKWPGWAGPEQVVLRASAGRAGDGRAPALDDDELVERLHAELAEALGMDRSPDEATVARWPGAFPQYSVGHLDRVEAVEAALARDLPGVVLAGASYRGFGIPACIAQGRAAARRVLGLT
ncbi:MAG: protoporphyrinogen oxidase, partial [Acidimicrobiales bacterium]